MTPFNLTLRNTAAHKWHIISSNENVLQKGQYDWTGRRWSRPFGVHSATCWFSAREWTKLLSRTSVLSSVWVKIKTPRCPEQATVESPTRCTFFSFFFLLTTLRLQISVLLNYSASCNLFLEGDTFFSHFWWCHTLTVSSKVDKSDFCTCLSKYPKYLTTTDDLKGVIKVRPLMAFQIPLKTWQTTCKIMYLVIF